MSTVNPARIEPGDARDAAAPNAVFTELANGSTGVDDENIAPEGVDAVNIDSEASEESAVIHLGSAASLTNTTFADLVLGGTTVERTGLTIGSGEHLLVEGQVSFEGGIPASEYVEACIGVASTSEANSVCHHGNASNEVNARLRPIWRITVAGTYTVSVMTRTTGGTYRVANASLVATIVRGQ